MSHALRRLPVGNRTSVSASARASWRRVGVGVAGAAVLATAVVTGAGTAAADPETTSTMSVPAIPYDAELAQAVRELKAAGVDQMALKAAEAVKGAVVGQLSADDIANRLTALSSDGAAPNAAAQKVAAPTVAPTAVAADPLAVLKALGIQPLTPSVAPFCAAPTADNPLGLVTAGAGAVPGPWPMRQDPAKQLPGWVSMIPGIRLPEKLNLVDKGETAFAFVPASPTTGGKMQVAWFNTNTLKGGFADLSPVADRRLAAVLPMLSGVRLAPVKTGSGTVLSAVYGTAEHKGRMCYFLPAVGAVGA